ncbi:type II secretion system F family protein [Falsiroseomonas oryziterrae]|uniref:type II secretion system F family protein n=1 Tax=Falsiroseomonas oryziterrae TaxID=2911368 RepID=UPI001F2D8F81|nr:type II secretion system F family protein [Roseomonas sp. NPKOSM-4]
MSVTLSILLAGAALLLVMAALALLPSRAERDLRRRAMGLGLAGGEQLEGGARQSLRALTAEERPFHQRALMALGQNPEVPDKYRTPPLILILITGSAMAGTWWAIGDNFGQLGGFLVTVLVGAVVLRFLFTRERTRYASLLLAQIPDAIGLVLRAVRTGLPVVEALRSIASEVPSPTAEEFGRVSQEVGIGIPVEDALWALYQRSELKEYAFLAVTVGLQAQAGGNLTETLANLADLVRKRVAMVSKVKAITAEARTSALILIGLPFVVAVILTVLNPEYVGDLFTHPKAGTLQAMFVVFMTLGIVTINTLIARATRD